MPCMPTTRRRCSCAITGGGRRAFVAASLVLLFLCIPGKCLRNRKKTGLPHSVFSTRVLDAARPVVSDDAGPSRGQSAAEYNQALARHVYEIVANLQYSRLETTARLMYRFGVIVWPLIIRPDFSDMVQFGKSANANRLSTTDGALPYTTCYNWNLEGGDADLGVPCPVGNSVHFSAATKAGQWMQCMVFYNSYVDVPKPVSIQRQDLFKEKVGECRSQAADDSNKPQVTLTPLAECVYSETATALGEIKAKFRGMAAIISYNSGTDIQHGNLHEAFGIWNPLGGLLIDHFTVTNRVKKSFMLMGKEIEQEQIRTVSVYFVSAMGTRHKGVDLTFEPGSSSRQPGK